jgi:mRNA interferase MazF
MVTRKTARYGDVWSVALDPIQGSEVRKTRPCVVVSPDEMNQWLPSRIVAPLTSTIKPYPSRVTIRFKGRQGQTALDQIRTVDAVRLVRRFGVLTRDELERVSEVLVEMFRVH